MPSGYRMTMTTVASAPQAAELARAIVEARLAACVQVVGARSVYRWSGTVEEADEQLLLIKTTDGRSADLEAFIAEHHAYDLPEVISVEITSGSEGYLGWLDENTRS